VLDLSPTQVFLASGLMPGDLDGLVDWTVLDPVQVGLRNANCRTSLTAALAENAALATAFAPALAALREPSTTARKWQHPAEPLKERVAAKAPMLPRTTAVFSRCCELEDLWTDLRSRDEDAAPALRRAMLVEAQALLEMVLEELAAAYPAPGAWRALNPCDKRFDKQNQALLEAKAVAVGFRPPLPFAISAQNCGDIRIAVEENRGSLRPRIAAALLTAASQAEHPLRDLAQSDPGILGRWDNIAKMRNRKAAHGGRKAEHVTLTEVCEAVGCVYHSVRLLHRLWADSGKATPSRGIHV
jgi:hypothetical protein